MSGPEFLKGNELIKKWYGNYRTPIVKAFKEGNFIMKFRATRRSESTFIVVQVDLIAGMRTDLPSLSVFKKYILWDCPYKIHDIQFDEHTVEFVFLFE